ncbi:MAG: putative Dynein heavy chain [Streblomastix strix]|uniref:Putative Dynein heavy chain n=1 Tax=Streblomastix strix TaxID=222440 RepID=A0A5J4X103_9EUKA|nr:MAG: putative Dynein heavy chain [Streblomastix strix]
MKDRDPETMATLTINFSNRTNSLQVYSTLDDSLGRPLMGVIRPRPGKNLIVFIDDLNMLQMDKEETQQPIALLKFLFDRRGLYGRSSSDLSFRKYQDIQFVATLDSIIGGRNLTDIRFSSKFSVFNLSFLTMSTTPNKFHYIFNLRDLSIITEILTISVSNKFKCIRSIVRLWSHEVLQAVNAYSEPLLFSSCKKANLSVGHLLPGEEKQVGDDQTKEDPKEYEDLESYDAFKLKVEECLESYNETLLRMNLVIDSSLLIGYGGSGKYSLTNLATFFAGYTLFQITLSRGYGYEAFRQDLKKLHNLLGTMNKEVVFLFTDQHVVDASFLEYIKSILTSGMVPALYAEDEKDYIIRELSEDD